MNALNKYLELQKTHREELNNFPIAYAFNDKQFVEALDKLGAKAEECVTIFSMGDIVKKVDAPRFKQMLVRHIDEIQELIKDEEVAEAAFLYEMDNHEYAISYDGDEEVLSVFGLNMDKLIEMNLGLPYRRAREKHMKNAREWV